MLTGKELNQFESNHARYFLYDVYAKEMNWTPPFPNPSEWVIKENHNGKFFSDRFDFDSQWFGVYDGFTLIACGRVLYPLENKLEVELYHPIPDWYKIRYYKLTEINRIAVKKEFLASGALNVLSLEFIKFFIKQKTDYAFASAYNAEMIDFLRSIGFKTMNPPVKFKYFKSDANAVNLMCLDCTDQKKIKNIIDSLQK